MLTLGFDTNETCTTLPTVTPWNLTGDPCSRPHETAELDPEAVAAASGPAETAARRERLRSLFRDLGQLPERQRAALTMRELGGLEFAQIGEALESSPAAARQTVYEARLGLREMEAGREMTCRDVTRELSDGDGRLRRRRAIRAHLRSCDSCRAFDQAINARHEDFSALSPLPAVAAAGLLSGVLGVAKAGAAATGSAGSAGGAATAGSAAVAGAGKAVATGVVLKSAATVAVVAAIGATAADRSGLVELIPRGEDQSQEQSPRSNDDPASESQATPAADGGRDAPGAQAGGDSGQSGAHKGGKGSSKATGGNSAQTGADRRNPRSTTLPGASRHGQQTAESHGGGRARGESQAQAKGGSGRSVAAERPPKPAQAKAAPAPGAAEPPTSGQVAPDKHPAPPSQPAEPPKGQGSTGTPGGPPPKEAG